MKTVIRSLVVAGSVGAVALLALSPSRAADTGSSGSADANPMGACCGQQPGTEKTPPPVTCGPGTVARGNTCVGTTPAK
jgi:hypothetical protein